MMERSADQFRLANDFVRVNISGKSFLLLQEDLKRAPKSRLSTISSYPSRTAFLYDDYFADSNEYYFERSRIIFEEVANYYRTGHLHICALRSVCLVEFLQEIQYWNLDLDNLGICCEGIIPDSVLLPPEPDKFEGQSCIGPRKMIYSIINRPRDSLLGMICASFLMFFIFFSTALTMATTMDCCRPASDLINNSTFDIHLDLTPEQEMQQQNFMLIHRINGMCTIWFTLELILGFWAAPNKLMFCIHPLSIINLLSVVPYYISIGVELNMANSMERLFIMEVLHGFVVIRALLFFRLVNIYSGLELIIKTFQKAWRELIFMLMVVQMLNIILSVATFYIERSSPLNPFNNVMVALYWAHVSTLTVGYGDYIPETVGGKIFACAGILSGIIIMAFLTALISKRFNQNYELKRTERLLKHAGIGYVKVHDLIKIPKN